MKKSVSRRSFGGATLGAFGLMALTPRHLLLIGSSNTSTAPFPEVLDQVVDRLSDNQIQDSFDYGQRWNRRRSRISKSQGANDKYRLARIGEDR